MTGYPHALPVTRRELSVAIGPSQIGAIPQIGYRNYVAEFVT